MVAFPSNTFPSNAFLSNTFPSNAMQPRGETDMPPSSCVQAVALCGLKTREGRYNAGRFCVALLVLGIIQTPRMCGGRHLFHSDWQRPFRNAAARSACVSALPHATAAACRALTRVRQRFAGVRDMSAHVSAADWHLHGSPGTLLQMITRCLCTSAYNAQGNGG